MLKPYRIHEAEQRASSFSRRPIVLARLPYVGQLAQVPPPQQREVEPPPQHHRPPAPVPASTVQSQEMTLEPPAYTQNTFHSQMEAANFVAPQLPTQSYSAEEPFAPQPAQLSTAPAPPAPLPQQPAPQPPTSQPQAGHQQSWSRSSHHSSGLYELQKQLSTNSGLIVTLALIASAAFLYMAIISPVEPPTLDYSNSYEFYGANQAAPTTSISADENSQHPEAVTAQADSPELPLDPFEIEAEEPSRDTLAKDDNAREGQENVDLPPTKGGFSFEPAKASVNMQPKVLPLPTVDENPELEVELIFDDASALNYPNTHRPIIDFGPLQVIEDDTEYPAAQSAVANRPQIEQSDAASR